MEQKQQLADLVRQLLTCFAPCKLHIWQYRGLEHFFVIDAANRKLYSPRNSPSNFTLKEARSMSLLKP